MKVIHHDKNTLIIQPSGIVPILAGASLFFILCAVLSIYSGTVSTLICERSRTTQIQCVQQNTFFGVTLKRTTFTGVQGARAARMERAMNPAVVVLATANGEQPVEMFTEIDPRDQQQVALEINTFVQSREPRFQKTRGNPQNIVIPFFFTGFLGMLVLFLGVPRFFSTWTFDRTSGYLTHHDVTPLGRRVRTYALRDIREIRIGIGRARKGGTYHMALLILQNGEQVIMGQTTSPVNAMPGYVPEVIREFLNLPKIEKQKM